MENNNKLWEEKGYTQPMPSSSVQESKDNQDIILNTKNDLIKKGLNDGEKISGIYKIVNKINGKYYVGSSADILSPNIGRWYKHKWMLKNNNHDNIHLQRAWNKYGGDSFEFKIVEYIEPAKLIGEEQKYLDDAKLNKNAVYNRTFIAGKIEMTEETRKKIGDKAKIRFKNNINHPLYDKTKYTLYNKLTGNVFVGTKQEFIKKYDSNECIYSLFSGKVKSILNCWVLNPKNDIKSNKGKMNPRYNKTIYSFYNTKTKESFNGTKFEFCQKFKLKRNMPDDLIRKWIKQSKTGWILKTIS